jgi:hypothetical protein
MLIETRRYYKKNKKDITFGVNFRNLIVVPIVPMGAAVTRGVLVA